MGKAQIGNGVQTVKLFSPAFRQLLAVVDGLSAAAGAAAGTGHHFHKVILHFAPAQSLDQPPGVAQAADYGHPNGGVGNVEGGLLPAVHTPHILEGIGGRVLAGDQVIGRTEGRFHDAAGGAENEDVYKRQVGHRVTVMENEPWEGKVIAISDSCGLVVEKEDGSQRHLQSGEVSIRPGQEVWRKES